MGFVGGLQLVGKFYHYKFKHNNIVLRGSTGCTTLPDAQRWLRQYRAKLALEEVGIRKAPTLEGLLQEWESVAAASNDSQQISSMRAQVSKHLKTLLSTPIDQLTTDRVQACLLAYLDGKGDGPGRQGHSTGGANSLLLRLNTLIGWAIRCNYLRKKPYDVKRFKTQQKPRSVVRTAQAKDFVEALEKISRSEDRRIAVGLQFALGVRESEALGARWEYVDIERGTMTVGRIEEGQFKTKGGEAREVPLPKWLLAWLRARWERLKKPTEGLVLPGPADPTTKAVSPHSAGYTRALVRRIGEELKISGLSPHRLRASFISALALEAKISIPRIQKIVGHKHIVTTMRYVEGAEDHEDAFAALEALQQLGGVPKKEPEQKIIRGSHRKKAS
jgi:integrase